jgi:hypothetical protein
MDLHLDDAVAQGNSMVSQMAGFNKSVKDHQEQNFQHWGTQAGLDLGIKDKAKSISAIGSYLGNTGEFGLGLAKEGKAISTLGLSAYAGKQLAGAATGVKGLTGVSALQKGYGAYKSATFTPGLVSSTAMKGETGLTDAQRAGFDPASMGFEGDVTHDAPLLRTGITEAGVGSQATRTAGDISQAATASSETASRFGRGALGTAETSGIAGTTALRATGGLEGLRGVSAVSDVSKGVGGAATRIGSALGTAAESGVGSVALGATKALGGVAGGVNLAEDFSGGKFHIAGQNKEERTANVSGMVSGALDVASFAVPVLAPIAAAIGLFSAIEGGLGAIKESSEKVSADKIKGAASMKDPTPESATNLQSAGLVAQARTDPTSKVGGTGSF